MLDRRKLLYTRRLREGKQNAELWGALAVRSGDGALDRVNQYSTIQSAVAASLCRRIPQPIA